MAVTFQLDVAPPPPELCISADTEAAIRDMISLLVDGELEGLTVYRQITPPSNTNSVWFKVDANGNNVGLLSYVRGVWRRIPPVGIGTRMYYSGPITGYFNPATLLGNHGDQFDGWKIDLDFKDVMVIDGSTYDTVQGHWLTGVASISIKDANGDVITTPTLTPAGGFAEISLTLDNVPRVQKPALMTTLWEADNDHPQTNGALWGVSTATHPANVPLIPSDNGVQTPIPVPILPPWVAMAMLVYVGTGEGT